MIYFFRISNYIGLLLSGTLFIITLVRFNTLLLKSKKYFIWFLQIFIIILILREFELSVYSIFLGDF